MTLKKDPSRPSKPGPDPAEKRAAALRENLKKRKAQQTARETTEKDKP